MDTADKYWLCCLASGLNMNNMEPLIHKLAKKNTMPSQLLGHAGQVIYDPTSMTSTFMNLDGESSSACAQSTDGTEPKNEADQVMDD